MAAKEGELLKNQLKGTGKKMPEIARLLGMTRQNLNYHLRKDKLDEDFKRLLNEKGKYIFHVEHIDKKAKAGSVIGAMVEDLVYLKASDKIQGQLLCKIAAIINKTSVEKEASDLEKSVSEEADRLYGEYGNK